MGEEGQGFRANLGYRKRASYSYPKMIKFYFNFFGTYCFCRQMLLVKFSWKELLVNLSAKDLETPKVPSQAGKHTFQFAQQSGEWRFPKRSSLPLTLTSQIFSRLLQSYFVVSCSYFNINTNHLYFFLITINQSSETWQQRVKWRLQTDLILREQGMQTPSEWPFGLPGNSTSRVS